MNIKIKNIIFIFIAFVLSLLTLYLYRIDNKIEKSKEGHKKKFQTQFFINGVELSKCPPFDKDRASKYIQLSLNCIDKEYPNKPNYVYESYEDLKTIRENTPAFFGCFDWHSAVHGHWAMVRILNKYPDIKEKGQIINALSNHLSNDNMQLEMLFLAMKRNNLFERPYGWGWLLRLATELKKSQIPELRTLYKNVDPFAKFICDKFIDYLRKLSRPIREGTHQNTAFSMIHLYDYLVATEQIDKKNELIKIATMFYFGDRDCPINYEPSGEDFISPCLVEAELMRRILFKDQFQNWFKEFIKIEKLEDETLHPVGIIDPTDPRIGHLIGLYYQRASAITGILSAINEDDERRFVLEKMIERNCGVAEYYLNKSGYGGEHWLATFAIFYYTNATLR